MKAAIRLLFAITLIFTCLIVVKFPGVKAQNLLFPDTCTSENEACQTGVNNQVNTCVQQNCKQYSGSPGTYNTCVKACNNQAASARTVCNNELAQCNSGRTNECYSNCQATCNESGGIQSSSYSESTGLPLCICTCNSTPATGCGGPGQSSCNNQCGTNPGPICPNGSEPLCTADPQGAAGWQCESPILLDVDGHGFHMTSAALGVTFTIDQSGLRDRWGWPDRDSTNAWLALDRNGNGKIDGAWELFGNLTEQPNSPKQNGFAALAVFDKAENGGNADGVINQKDAIFSKLLLWTDKNHDGISQPDELQPIAQSDIAQIDLDYVEANRMDANGNAFHYRARVWTKRGEHGGRYAWDVYPNVLRH